MKCTYCGASKFHQSWCPTIDGEVETKGERRQSEREGRGSHPIHGRGLENIMNSMRNRARKIEQEKGR